MTLRLPLANRPSSLLQDLRRRLRYIEVLRRFAQQLSLLCRATSSIAIFSSEAKEAGAVFTHGPGLRKQKNCMFSYSMRQGMQTREADPSERTTMLRPRKGSAEPMP